jgi:hypothetical protein
VIVNREESYRELSDEEFGWFAEEAERWRRELGLTDWKLVLRTLPVWTGHIFEVKWKAAGTADVFVSREWPERLIDEALIRREAFELMAGLAMLWSGWDPDAVKGAVNRLASVLMGGESC